jgi:hypothetical protein
MQFQIPAIVWKIVTDYIRIDRALYYLARGLVDPEDVTITLPVPVLGFQQLVARSLLGKKNNTKLMAGARTFKRRRPKTCCFGTDAAIRLFCCCGRDQMRRFTRNNRPVYVSLSKDRKPTDITNHDQANATVKSGASAKPSADWEDADLYLHFDISMKNAKDQPLHSWVVSTLGDSGFGDTDEHAGEGGEGEHAGKLQKKASSVGRRISRMHTKERRDADASGAVLDTIAGTITDFAEAAEGAETVETVDSRSERAILRCEDDASTVSKISRLSCWHEWVGTEGGNCGVTCVKDGWALHTDVTASWFGELDKNEKEKDSLLQDMATKLQSAYRGRHARKMAAVLKDHVRADTVRAVTKVQSLFRGISSRRAVRRDLTASDGAAGVGGGEVDACTQPATQPAAQRATRAAVEKNSEKDSEKKSCRQRMCNFAVECIWEPSIELQWDSVIFERCISSLCETICGLHFLAIVAFLSQGYNGSVFLMVSSWLRV